MKQALTSIWWLIRDTFRQALASGIFWLMLAVSALCMLWCLFVPPAGSDPGPAVRNQQLRLVGWVADMAGLALALVWTGGFLPTFLDASAVAVLLAKPLPRWALLTGKYVGVLAFIAFQAIVFVTATWLALGLRTGVWDLAYFLCVPILLLHFAIFFSFSAMLAVATRSTAACTFGSLLFWMLCWGMNLGRDQFLVLPDIQGLTPLFGRTIEIGYWVLPKPLDFHFLLQETLRADNVFAPIVELGALEKHGGWLPGWSLLSSSLFGLVMLGVAAYDFLSADY